MRIPTGKPLTFYWRFWDVVAWVAFTSAFGWWLSLPFR